MKMEKRKKTMQDDLAEGKVSRNHEEMPVLFFKKTDTNVAICGCFYLLLYFVTFIHRIESLHTGKQLIFTKERNLQKKKRILFSFTIYKDSESDWKRSPNCSYNTVVYYISRPPLTQ